MNKTLAQLKAEYDARLSQELLQLTDKSVPLDSRWATLESMVKGKLLSGDVPSDSNGFVSILRKDLVDDFYVDKHQTVCFVSSMWLPVTECDASDAAKDEWREAVLEFVLTHSTSEFTFDW